VKIAGLSGESWLSSAKCRWLYSSARNWPHERSAAKAYPFGSVKARGWLAKQQSRLGRLEESVAFMSSVAASLARLKALLAASSAVPASAFFGLIGYLLKKASEISISLSICIPMIF